MKDTFTTTTTDNEEFYVHVEPIATHQSERIIEQLTRIADALKPKP